MRVKSGYFALLDAVVDFAVDLADDVDVYLHASLLMTCGTSKRRREDPHPQSDSSIGSDSVRHV